MNVSLILIGIVIIAALISYVVISYVIPTSVNNNPPSPPSEMEPQTEIPPLPE